MAARFFVVGGVDTNWSTIGNWSTTSGGAGGSAVPSALDDVTFDANSGSACVLNTATAKLAKTFVTTNYTGSLTFNIQLSVSGSITIGVNTTFAGTTTNKLRMIAAGTWTTNGVTIPQDIEIGGTTTFTCTLVDALTTTGTLFLTNTTSTIFSGAFEISAANCTISGGQTLTLVEDVNISGLTTSADANVLNGSFLWKTGGLTTTGNVTGTQDFLFNGTGTWTGAAGSLTNDATINTAGTLTLSGTILYGTGALVYTAGTVAAGSSTLSLASGSGTANWNTGGMTWNNVTISAGTTTTVTLGSDLNISGTLTLGNTTSTTFSGAFAITATTATISGTQTVTIAGDVTTYSTTISDNCVLNGATFDWKVQDLTLTGALSGTATIFFWTSGSWTGTATLSNNVEFAADVTFVGASIAYGTGTITNTGASALGGGSTVLNLVANCTLNLQSVAIVAPVTITAAITLTLTSQLIIVGTLTLPNAAFSFAAGSADCTVDHVTNTSYTATRIVTFAAGMSFQIQQSMANVGTTAAIRSTWKTTGAGVQAFVFLVTGVQDIGFLDPTDLDASGAEPIFTYHGTITNSPGWINTYPILEHPPLSRNLIVQSQGSY